MFAIWDGNKSILVILEGNKSFLVIWEGNKGFLVIWEGNKSFLLQIRAPVSIRRDEVARLKILNAASRSRIDNIAPGACITCLVAILEVERAKMEDSGA